MRKGTLEVLATLLIQLLPTGHIFRDERNYIFRFDVSVNDSIFVQIAEGCGKIIGNRHALDEKLA